LGDPVEIFVGLRGPGDREMQERQKRVIDENNELHARTEKLEKFLLSETFLGLPVYEQSDLQLQHSVMVQFQSILARRISRF